MPKTARYALDGGTRGLGASTPPKSKALVDTPLATGTLSIEVVRELAELGALEPQWQELADHASEANPFYEPWAVVPALMAFRSEVEFVCVYRSHPSPRTDERQLCGLFPIERRRASGLVRLPMLSLWRHPYVYLGVPLVRAGLEREVLSCFLDWFAEGGWKRGLLRIEDLPGDGPLRIALVDEIGRRGWAHTTTQTYSRAILRPAKSADGYLERVMLPKRRKEYRRQAARLAEAGAVEVAELSLDDDPLVWAKEYAALENRGWKGRRQVDIAAQAAHLQFFVQLMLRASNQRRCMALSLRLDGKPIAMKLNLLSRQGSVAFKITYDEAWAKLSPGVLLEIENIRRVHARGDIPWMDSCAAHNRVMINRLWSDRREMQTVIISNDHPLSSLVVSALPPVRWASRFVRRSKAVEVADGE